ncbi:hypothetical protein ACTD5D_04155 [Nocardia takedensis]|uniref:hypothetical protein n=1 Tax=Nocardia takedensis TaxID=259390 RepID=UPI0002DA05F5|nr:hypothetical protein [Nocardia takedensis]
MAGTPHDPIAASALDHPLSDEPPADDPAPPWLPAAATAAAALTGTRHIRLDIARAAVLGFDADLAELVLAHERYRDELRRYWADHGIPDRITVAAAEDSDLGELITLLIDSCGPLGDDPYAREDDVLRASPEEIVDTSCEPIDHCESPEEIAGSRPPAREADAYRGSPGGTIDATGSWQVSPVLPPPRAAADPEQRTPAFHARHEDWHLEYHQSVAEDGTALLEVRVDPGIGEALAVVRVDLADSTHLIVLRAIRGRLAGHLTITGLSAWGRDAVTLYKPFPPTDIPDTWATWITSAVARASTADRGLWRRIQRTLGPAAAVSRAIAAALP